VTITSSPIAASVSAVSARVSPFPRLEAPGGKETTSAPTRPSAIANDVYVRVLASNEEQVDDRGPRAEFARRRLLLEGRRPPEQIVEFRAAQIVKVEEATTPHGRRRRG
jgi:hypothetical protein